MLGSRVRAPKGALKMEIRNGLHFFVHPSSEADIPYWNIFLDTGRNFARCLPDDFVVLYLGDIVTPRPIPRPHAQRKFPKRIWRHTIFRGFCPQRLRKGVRDGYCIRCLPTSPSLTARSARPEINVLFRTDCSIRTFCPEKVPVFRTVY